MLPYHLFSSYSFPLVGTIIYVTPDVFEVVGIPCNYVVGQFWVYLAQCYRAPIFPRFPSSGSTGGTSGRLPPPGNLATTCSVLTQ